MIGSGTHPAGDRMKPRVGNRVRAVGPEMSTQLGKVT